MPSLLSIPRELLQDVLMEVNSDDLGRLSRCGKELHVFIANNRLLWKELYLRNFDSSANFADQEPDWKRMLRDLTIVRKVMESNKSDAKEVQFYPVASQVQHLLRTANPRSNASQNLKFLDYCFVGSDSHQQRTQRLEPLASRNMELFLCRSSIFIRAGENRSGIDTPDDIRQLSAKLHVLHGAPIEAASHISLLPRSAKLVHPYARSLVYDLRRYTPKSLWGPFQDDGSLRVDWEKVEAIMIVLDHNHKVITEGSNGHFKPIWNTPWQGSQPMSYVPRKESCPMSAHRNSKATSKQQQKTPLRSLDAQDPYGISGTWRRVVCFLDYHKFFAYNFETARASLSELPEPLETDEAIRLITVNLRVTRIEPPDPENGDILPTVHFVGTSRSMHSSLDPNASSAIRGVVKPTPDGEIRWTTLSIIQGEERWRSEGVQIGGLRSARGVLGTWFDKNFDPHGPVGPTAFWKLNDYIDDEPYTF